MINKQHDGAGNYVSMRFTDFFHTQTGFGCGSGVENSCGDYVGYGTGSGMDYGECDDGGYGDGEGKYNGKGGGTGTFIGNCLFSGHSKER